MTGVDDPREESGKAHHKLSLDVTTTDLSRDNLLIDSLRKS